MPTASPAPADAPTFGPINRAYGSVFRPGKLSLGLVVPIENYAQDPVPTMTRHRERVQLAEELGFGAVWLRDVPFHVPSFGDAGQTYDPFVYLGLLSAWTERIALGVASVILPLRHPAHVAKAAATADALSGGRLLLGVASGDRPEEYPALNQTFPDRGDRFRYCFDYIRRMAEPFPALENEYGDLDGRLDMLPKPTAGRLPLLITGASQQSPEWLAQHGDGWMIYPRAASVQERIIGDWRGRIAAAGRPDQPVMQPLYVDLTEDPKARPEAIHLGLRLGLDALHDYLTALERVGVNHVALNLRFQQRDTEDVLRFVAEELLPDFRPGPVPAEEENE